MCLWRWSSWRTMCLKSWILVIYIHLCKQWNRMGQTTSAPAWQAVVKWLELKKKKKKKKKKIFYFSFQNWMETLKWKCESMVPVLVREDNSRPLASGLLPVQTDTLSHLLYTYAFVAWALQYIWCLTLALCNKSVHTLTAKTRLQTKSLVWDVNQKASVNHSWAFFGKAKLLSYSAMSDHSILED